MKGGYQNRTVWAGGREADVDKESWHVTVRVEEEEITPDVNSGHETLSHAATRLA